MADRRIVVVGHGAAGLCAALHAAAAAQVTVVEHAAEDDCGGNSRWSPSNIRMASPTTMTPGFVDEIVAESGGRADRAYFEKLAAEAPATVAWLQSLGLEFHRPPYYLAKGPARIQPVGGGEALFGALRAAAAKAGIEFRYQRGLRRLVAEGKGVVGVELDDPAETLRADAVVLACGGFEGNGAMLQKHFGAGAERMRPICPGTRRNNGAGIVAALQAGALPAGDWNGMHAEPVDARCEGSAPVVLVYPYGIVVDRAGRRFFDEGADLMYRTWETFARHLHFAASGRIAYAVLDSALYGIADYGRAIRSTVAPWQSESLAGLAAQMAVPAATLEETVRAYNAAATGDASRFDATRTDGLATAPGFEPRKSNWARPLASPPYLAWPLVGAIAYTFGGIQTDADARVIGKHGPIPGLYAAGEITGHFYGTAPNAVAMLRALVFGRIAGRNASQ